MTAIRFPFPSRKDAIHTLERDYVYGKIPRDDVPLIINRAWQTGLDAAESFLKNQKRDCIWDFLQIFRDQGFQVSIKDEDVVSGSMRYFADSLPKQKKVTIYSRSVNLWAQANQLTFEEAQNFILMHEYFHYLEYSGLGFVSRQYQVPMVQIGKLKLGRTGVAALSEIAADAFAKFLFHSIIKEKLYGQDRV
jgi:hypothetical protein